MKVFSLKLAREYPMARYPPIRSAIDADPVWWARKAKEYLHIPDVLDEKWFKGSGDDIVFRPEGKDKFILALIGAHFKDTASAALFEVQTQKTRW